MRKIKDIGEFGLIEEFAELFPVTGDIKSGIGDDCAVIHRGDKWYLLTTDALIEDVHFDLHYSKPFLLGYKSLAVSLSDIAAMAGKPVAAGVSLGVPSNIELDFVLDFAKGLRRCSKKYHCPIVGGDTVRSPSRIFVNVTVLGESDQEPILRSGAIPGDLVAVAGTIGESMAGSILLLSKSINGKMVISDRAYKEKIVVSHLQPEPLLAEAVALHQALRINSMIDISDGLSSELNHIAKKSKVKIVIEENRIPISKPLREFCREWDQRPVELALAGGEDYALLFTFPKVYQSNISLCKFKAPITIVGEVRSGRGVCIKTKDGIKPLPAASSFTHF